MGRSKVGMRAGCLRKGSLECSIGRERSNAGAQAASAHARKPTRLHVGGLCLQEGCSVRQACQALQELPRRLLPLRRDRRHGRLLLLLPVAKACSLLWASPLLLLLRLLQLRLLLLLKLVVLLLQLQLLQLLVMQLLVLELLLLLQLLQLLGLQCSLLALKLLLLLPVAIASLRCIVAELLLLLRRLLLLLLCRLLLESAIAWGLLRPAPLLLLHRRLRGRPRWCLRRSCSVLSDHGSQLGARLQHLVRCHRLQQLQHLRLLLRRQPLHQLHQNGVRLHQRRHRGGGAARAGRVARLACQPALQRQAGRQPPVLKLAAGDLCVLGHWVLVAVVLHVGGGREGGTPGRGM